MNDRGSPLPCLHHEPKTDRVVLGHVGAHDDYAVGVSEIILRGGRASASQPGAQTGHRRAMSYTGLIFDVHDSEPGGKELFDNVVFLVVQRRATEMRYCRGPVHRSAVRGLMDEGLVSRLLHERGDAVHRPIERFILPVVAPWRPILHGRHATRIYDQPVRRRSLRAKRPTVDEALVVAFNRKDRFALVIDQLRAADGAVRANAYGNLSALEPETDFRGPWTDRPLRDDANMRRKNLP